MEQQIFINGEIGWWADLYKDVIWTAQAMPLKVLIDSPGGSVTDGNSIAGLLRQHANSYGVEVETIGVGMVASIATIMLIAGTKVKMDKDALLMIHNPRAEWVSGESKELRKVATTLDVIKSQLAESYVNRIERSGKLIDGDRQKTKNVVLQYMAQETWFTAQEAKDFGLIDEVIDLAIEDKAAAQATIDAMPEDAMQRVASIVNCFTNIPTPEEGQKQKTQKMDDKEFKGFFATLKSFFTNSAKAEAEVIEETKEEVQEETTADTQSDIEMLKAEMQALKEQNEALSKDLEASKTELKNTQSTLVTMQAKATDKKPEQPAKEEKKLTPADGVPYFANILKKDK